MEGEWKSEEKQYLIDNRNSMTVKELAEKLNRTVTSVHGKIMNLGLKKEPSIAIGVMVNRLTIIKKLQEGLYECLCKCGKTIEVHKGRLYGKDAIKSCGCHKKIAKQLVDIKTVSPETYSYRFLYARYLNNAKVGHTPFSLTFEKFIEVARMDCTYCGVKPRLFNARSKQKKLTQEEKDAHTIYANGIDRIDSSVGYTPTNVVTACKECNYAKRDLTLEEWNAYLDRISSFRASYKLQNNIPDPALAPPVPKKSFWDK